MELSREIIADVIKQRTSGSSSAKENVGLESSQLLAIKEAEVFLGSGLSIAIHIMLGHADCKAKEPSRCPAVRQLEVWTMKVVGDGMPLMDLSESKGAQMPPMFLKQAIRSQLHFSPIKSWFSTTQNQGFCCIYKISTSSHFEADEGALEEHRFPVCKVDNRIYLQAQVKWLKKGNFPRECPECPCKRIDDDHWVFPAPRALSDGLQCTGLNGLSLGSRKKSLSRQNSGEEGERNGQRTPTPNHLRLSRKSSSGSIHSPQRKGSVGREQPVNLAPLSEVELNNKGDAVFEEDNNSSNRHHTPRLHLPNSHQPIPGSNQSKPSGCVDIRHVIPSTCLAFNPTTRLPLNSSPAPLKRMPNTMNENMREHNQQPDLLSESPSSSGSESELAILDTVNDEPLEESKWVGRRRRVPSGLLCNFEESALNGRLEPVNSVDGFRLQIAITGKNFSQLTVPVTTFYFKANSEGDEVPSLYMGQCNLSKLRRKELHIPKRCTLQAVLFNPQGSVVKIFLVSVDVSDMPAKSKTFIRQRTFSTTTTNQKQTTPATGTLGQSNRTGMVEAAQKSTLKFLIHLRLASDHRSRVFLHSDIKMLLSNKGTDLEGLLEVGSSNKLDSSTQMPQEPKYSPIK